MGNYSGGNMKKKVTAFFLIVFLTFVVTSGNNVFAFQNINVGLVNYAEADPDEILTDPDFDLNSVDAGVLSNWYSSEINVPDEALKKALQTASKTDKLTVEAMFSLPTSLDLTGMNIKNLTGLEYAINVTDLDISDNEVESLEPIRNLYNLKTLNYSHNNVSEVSSWVLGSDTLISIDGSYNGSTKIDSFEANKSNLKILYLENNKLTELPEMKGLSSLETLSLANNEFAEYPTQLSQLAKLKVLSLSGNKLTEIESMASNTALTTLYLNYNELTSLPGGIEALGLLSEVSISHNKIEEISESISLLQSLERFDISFNLLTDIPENISEISGLQMLDVNFNFIDINGDVADKLKKMDSSIDNFYYSLQLPEFEVHLYNDYDTVAGRLEWTSVIGNSSNDGSYSVVKYVIERKDYVDEVELPSEVADDALSDASENMDSDDNVAENDEDISDIPEEEPKLNEFEVIGETEASICEFVDETAKADKEYVYRVTAYIEGEYKSHGKVTISLENTVMTSEMVNSISGYPLWMYIAIGAVALCIIGFIIYKVLKNKKNTPTKTDSKKVNDNSSKPAIKIVSNEHISSTSKEDLEDELDRILFSAKEEAEDAFPGEAVKPAPKDKSEIGNIFEEVKNDKKKKK